MSFIRPMYKINLVITPTIDDGDFKKITKILDSFRVCRGGGGGGGGHYINGPHKRRVLYTPWYGACLPSSHGSSILKYLICISLIISYFKSRA